MSRLLMTAGAVLVAGAGLAGAAGASDLGGAGPVGAAAADMAFGRQLNLGKSLSGGLLSCCQGMAKTCESEEPLLTSGKTTKVVNVNSYECQAVTQDKRVRV